jgi:hypothetical protein
MDAVGLDAATIEAELDSEALRRPAGAPVGEDTADDAEQPEGHNGWLAPLTSGNEGES